MASISSTYYLYVVPSGRSIGYPYDSAHVWYDSINRYRYYVIPYELIGKFEEFYDLRRNVMDMPQFVRSITCPIEISILDFIMDNDGITLRLQYRVREIYVEFIGEYDTKSIKLTVDNRDTVVSDYVSDISYHTIIFHINIT